jgi:hypothetical protein
MPSSVFDQMTIENHSIFKFHGFIYNDLLNLEMCLFDFSTKIEHEINFIPSLVKY